MYQALYRKYRPQIFDDVVGQQHITQTLKNQVMNGRLSHAYLFTGTRGTGKTTCAKILAKAANCENPVDGNPCNHCAACRSIDQEACMEVQEIDAASNNGVDNVRNIRDEAVYPPAQVKKRVYIIDEVHMLTTSAFNALLKIIEEPPPYVMFILATTEIHKVPATILSRCQRFAFRRILPGDIVDRLNYIAYQEKIDLNPDAAAFLARLADGGLRDATSLLDQCASASSGEVTVDSVCRVLGVAGTRQTADLLQAISQKDTAKVLEIFNEQYIEGKDLAAMLDELCQVCRDLLILKASRSGSAMASGICTEQELKALLPLFGSGELLRMTGLLRDTAAGFNTSANRRIDAELCLIRLCEPEAVLDAESLNSRLSRVENQLARGVVCTAAPAEEKSQEEKSQDERPPWDDDDVPPEPGEYQVLHTEVDDFETKPAGKPAKQKKQTKKPEPPGFWPELVKTLRSTLKPPAVAMFVVNDNAPVKGILDGDVLLLETADDFVARLLNRPELLKTVQECASAQLGRPVKVKLTRKGEGDSNNDSFQRLMDFGQTHPDIVDFK